MADEPTVHVEQDPCPVCKGEASRPASVASGGKSRSVDIGGTCPTCQGEGKLVRDVPLSELRGLLENPESFR